MNRISEAFTELRAAIENGVFSPALTQFLRESLFYYCSGKDATPVSAFGADVPLYVYSDSFKYMRVDFNGATKALYNQLKKLGHTVEEVRRLPLTGITSVCQNAEISLWKNVNDRRFILLYTQSDAVNLYEKIYFSENLLPKYFCNYRYEMSHRGVMEQDEKRAEYILGHCHSEEFECVGEYDYLGDYVFEKKTKVKLYRRTECL